MEFKRFSNDKEFTKRVAEHEIFLSFYDDIGAEAFEQWLYEEGMKLFAQWLKQDEQVKYFGHMPLE